MDRIKRLLAFGYFPSQLPPCFVSKDLADNYASLYSAWLDLQETPKKGLKIPKAPDTKSEIFSVARAGLQRRITSLPNPVAQTYVATHVALNWGDILKHYRQAGFSKSRPRFKRNGSRAASIPSMQALYDNKVIKSAGYRYMLQTDISRFFPTIYTHSIPWALHGKSVAKKNKKPTAKYFGNLLDQSLRQCQDGQTIGLPIGPDTSHIIAEAIATAIDVELKKKLKDLPAGFRYVDDYFMFFSTVVDAEAALAALVSTLKDFELQVNFEKTKICSVQEITDDYWTHQLRSFEISTSGKKQASDVNHFFELAKDLARRNADESVMTYAIKRSASVLIRKENWACFEAHICHVAMGYSNTLQTVARLLSTYAKAGYPIGKLSLQRLVSAIIKDHAPLGHHSEVTWCLWMCKDLDIALNDESIDLVSSMYSSVCALLLMDLHHSGKLRKAPKTTLWKSTENTDSLYGDLWLLSYEAGLRGWCGFSNLHILADDHFSKLLAMNVHFYDDMASIKPMFHPSAVALAMNNVANVADFFDLEDAQDYLEYDHDDGGYEGVIVGGDDEDDEDDEDDGGYEGLPF